MQLSQNYRPNLVIFVAIATILSTFYLYAILFELCMILLDFITLSKL